MENLTIISFYDILNSYSEKEGILWKTNEVVEV